MTKTAQQIADDIYNHLNGGTEYANFYIGITNDIDRRLFGEHNVSSEHNWWIYREAINDEHSRAAEQHFLDQGMQGGGGGGDNSSVWVYCYRITNSTIE